MDILSESVKLNIKEEEEIKIRTYFSIQHIQAAALFCRYASEIEKQYDGTYNQELFTRHRAYVTNSIFSSVCFLEATINEFFCDAIDNPSQLSCLGESKMKLLSKMWSMNIPRTAAYSIVDKYQVALTLLEKELFDTSKTPFQDVQALIKLRNALMHYEPEWILSSLSHNYEQEELSKLAKALRGKFAVAQLYANTGNPFFPDKCLGHGCAEWAINNSVSFVDEFYTKTGLKSNYEHVRSNLLTK